MAHKGEKSSLLKGGASGSYGKPGQTDTPEDSQQHHAETSQTSGDKQQKQPHPPSKRDRLQRNKSLEKVDEDLDKDEKKMAAKDQSQSTKAVKTGFGCSDYFGVRSYLHNFYESRPYKDPEVYEEDDYAYLLHPHGQRRRRCTSIWWKVFVWIGANFLLFGVIGVLVGYMVPQRPIIVGSYEDAHQNVEIIDKGAIAFNFNLDVCKLVGLILFCIGGMTLTVALLFPSFLYQYCEDERRDPSFKVSILQDPPPKSPLEMSIPSTSNIKNIQPERKTEESLVAQEGLVSMKE